MKIREFKEKIEVADDVELAVAGSSVTIKGQNGEVTKEFKMPRFILSSEGKNLVVLCKDYNVYDKRNFFTIKAHLKNLIKGVQEGYTYTLKICSSHFPMNVTVTGNKLIVKNLLGEKVPRELKLKEGAKVEIKGDLIEVTGLDLELVSQVAADIEKLTKITNKDRRIFQDGIYMTHKAGKAV